MSSPSLKHADFALIATPTNDSAVGACTSVDRGDNPLHIARAIFIVSVMGAGFWYVLWKMALHFFVER